jgi:hypothetical protein
LFNQNVIDKLIVGLNFENPLDANLVSTITFGYFDINLIQNGSQGLNWYDNIGRESWAIILDELKYNGYKLQN